jgi:hypothetical protein
MTGAPVRKVRRYRVAVGLVLALVTIASGVYARGWYYERFVWPKKIQMEVLGEVLVSHDSLRDFEGSLHRGQGMLRWTYDMPSASMSMLAKYCDGSPAERCHFVKQGEPEPEVKTSVSYKNRLVVVEEWWL